MGCSAASDGRGSKVEMEAGHRKKVWDGEFSVVRSQMYVVVCFHLQEAAVYMLFSSKYTILYLLGLIKNYTKVIIIKVYTAQINQINI